MNQYPLDIDYSKLDETVQFIRDTLSDGLIATDTWTADGQTLAGYNRQPNAVDTFTKLTRGITDTLGSAGFPQLNNYYLMDLEGDHMTAVINHKNGLYTGILVTTTKVNKGIYLTVCIPGVMKRMDEAVR